MRIAFVVHDYDQTIGHSRYVMELTKRLYAAHEIHIFANTFSAEGSDYVHFHQVPAWRSRALLSVYTFPIGLRTQTAALAGFQIRHMQGYCGGKPNVVTAHICVAKYLASLRDPSFRTRASLRMMAFKEGRFYRGYEGLVVAISQKIADELREFYRVRGPIHVIPHGVDKARFSSLHREFFRTTVRNHLGISEDETVALYVGDLAKAHSHLKALAEAAPEVRFIIVSRTLQYRWQATNVQFLPPTDQIEKYYAAADAFVFPTTYDAFGMVVLEALATDLPVFTSDCAGAAELITHGVDGFVIPLRDWVEATREGLRNPILMKSVGRRAEQIAARYDWSAVAHAVEQVYREVAQSGN
jgi:UDP-glucose:(heptosyl)LPS alpha-1,3-glucosyltransferase